MEGTELISYQIISTVGTARSCYIEGIQLAKTGCFNEAYEQLKEGENFFNEGHKAHRELVQKEANGEKTEFSLILMHAEDQLMSAEGFRILAEEFIEVYKAIENKKY